MVAEAKVTREQVRAQNKESLMEIIDNENLSDEQKQDAVNQMVAMTDYAEKEAAAETLLASKGFTDAVVSMTADSADVVVCLLYTSGWLPQSRRDDDADPVHGAGGDSGR